MIITPDDKRSPDSKAQMDKEVGVEEPPPSYTPPTGSAVSGSSSLSPSGTFKTKPTNFLALYNEHEGIRGEFVIDPSIRIPSSVLPPLDGDQTEDDRKNLSLRSKSGSVNAEIWLLSPQGDSSGTDARKPRATIALTSDHGNVQARVRSPEGVVSLSLTAISSHGNVRLAVPRSFEGLLSLSTRHGSMSLSDALVQNATQLSQVGTARRYFIGDFRLLGEDAWQGDQIEIDAPHGVIRIKYIDEVTDAQGKKGLLSRLFGK